MRNSLNCFRWIVILGISLFLLARDGWAAVEILESSVLGLESSYLYRVIEKSTGEVLKVQDNASFIIGDEAYPVAEATNAVEDADGIHGSLIVETAGREQLPDGAPDRGHVSFALLWPETLQIHITYNNASPSEVSEQFDDQGEHYYGIWEYPFCGHKVNNNWDANWVPKLEIDIFPSRARASQFEYFSAQGVQKILVGTAPDGITIQFGDLAAGGNLEVYCKRVRGKMKDGKTMSKGSDYHHDPQPRRLTVPSTGAANLQTKGADGLFD